MKIVLWIAMLVSLVSCLPLVWMGFVAPTMPKAMALLGILVLLALGWQAASLADTEN